MATATASPDNGGMATDAQATMFGMETHPAFSRQAIPGYRVHVTLVACGKDKADEPQLARDMYRGVYTRKMIARAERSEWDAGSPADATPWFIVSARYGLTDPDDVVFPYDQSVCRMSRSDREAWGAQVAAELLAICPGSSLEVTILAGRKYRDAIAPALEAAGARVVATDLDGQEVGDRKATLNARAARDAEFVARWAAVPYEDGPLTREAWEAAQ